MSHYKPHRQCQWYGSFPHKHDLPFIFGDICLGDRKHIIGSIHVEPIHVHTHGTGAAHSTGIVPQINVSCAAVGWEIILNSGSETRIVTWNI